MSAPVEDSEKQSTPPPLPGAHIRSRRSAAEPDRITRFASPNRFDTLDVPLSFLDRRPTATSPSSTPSTFQCGPSNGGTVPWRSSMRSNMDTITRRAVPERCISQDWLITPRTGQAYQTSHSAMVAPCRISTSQSLPVRRKPAGKKLEGNGAIKGFPRTASTVGTGGLMNDRLEENLGGQSHRLSELTASVQRMLHEREEERKRISRQQFELQIGSKQEVGAEEKEISPKRANRVAAKRPILWETSSDSQELTKISQEAVNDFFSSPLTDSPEYGDMVTVASINRQRQELERARAVAAASAISACNDNEATRANTRKTICSDSTRSKRLTVPADVNGHSDAPPEAVPEAEVVHEGGDIDQQLDDLAGRMGLIERSPSSVERAAKKGVPRIADDSYRNSTALRHMSEPDAANGDDKKKERRTRSMGGNSFINFWRHISPRLSRRGRRSMASTPEVTRRDRERARSSSTNKKSRHSDAESKKSIQSSQYDDKEWDSFSSEPARRPVSLATTSSCPSPDSVFVSNDSTEFVQPVVNKQVMASLEKDRVRDPYQSFKNRSQQQQRNQQNGSHSGSPSTPRPTQLSVNSSTPSSSSAPRSSTGIKSPASSTSSSSARYLNVAVSAFGYALRRNGEKSASQPTTEDGERLSEDNPPTTNGKETEEETMQTATRPNSLSTRTASEEGRSSPTIMRRRGKTTPSRGGLTPTSPLNRSFDSQAANRSSLIMLAVGHSSPRPKSLSVSAADEVVLDATEEGFPAPVRTPGRVQVKEEIAEEEGKDGRHFLRIVDTREQEIRSMIAVTENDLKEHGVSMTEEVSGILRTAIGKATLLVTDKFAQFRGLCHQNLAAGVSNGSAFATLSSDLEGFWEMVELQVSDIRRMFAEIDALRANAWQRAASDVPDNTNGVAPVRKKAAPRRVATDASKSREEARKRLLAAKREAMARRKAAEATNVTTNDVIFV